MTTGELIRIARKKAGLTQKQLGELCGIAEPTIRRYELGKLHPKRETLLRIAKPLGVNVFELYGDSNGDALGELASYKYDASNKILHISPSIPLDDMLPDLLAFELDMQRTELASLFSSLNRTGRIEALKSLRAIRSVESYTLPEHTPSGMEMLEILFKLNPSLADIVEANADGQFSPIITDTQNKEESNAQKDDP